jgi:hypothetical protein
MPRKKNSKRISLLLFALTLSSCTSVKLTDNEWCGDLGSLGASCFHTLSDDSRDVEKAKWDEERVGMLCTNSDSFANWKAAILKLCKETKMCTYEQKEMIEKLSARVESFKNRPKKHQKGS